MVGEWSVSQQFEIGSGTCTKPEVERIKQYQPREFEVAIMDGLSPREMDVAYHPIDFFPSSLTNASRCHRSLPLHVGPGSGGYCLN
ncbi:Uncharacterized protein HZ326_9092 [Fusarium oxysporum f. sp. albedinis]|nr:Uncharacterized protein HZ326_9092 [Fusarium oxysporum f. sp. albedinis]